MDCEKLRDLVSDFVDNELLDDLCKDIKAHLKTCRDCEVHVDTVRRTILLYKTGSDVKIEMPMHAYTQLEAMLAKEYEKS